MTPEPFGLEARPDHTMDAELEAEFDSVFFPPGSRSLPTGWPAREVTFLPSQVKIALAELRRRLIDSLPGELNQIILCGPVPHTAATPFTDIQVMVVVHWDETPRGNEPGPRKSSFRSHQVIYSATEASAARCPNLSVLVVDEGLYRRETPVLKDACRGTVLWTNPTCRASLS